MAVALATMCNRDEDGINRMKEQAQRLRERLEIAAYETGLTSVTVVPELSSVNAESLTCNDAVDQKQHDRKTSASADLYRGILSTRSPVPATPVSFKSPSTSNPSRSPFPRTPTGEPTATEWFNQVAASPRQQTPCPSGSLRDQTLHNSEQAITAPSGSMTSPVKRRRVDEHASFTSPHRPITSPTASWKHKRIVSPLARDLGFRVEMSPSRRLQTSDIASLRHSRTASTSSIPDPSWDSHFVPVRSYDPLPRGTPNAISSTQHKGEEHSSVARSGSLAKSRPNDATSIHASRSSPRGLSNTNVFVPPKPRETCTEARTRGIGQSSQIALEALHTRSNTHRRSVSYNILDTSVPVSHDRYSGITTPSIDPPSLPMTPKSLAPTSSYGDLLSVSPTPKPRHAPRNTPGSTQSTAPLRRSNHHRFISEDLRARSTAPLWAQSPSSPFPKESL
ncbi:hypothetical protein MYAM1_000546 [Malassezia yamatoensis]|uniref:Uncharacterized protein n=1 Tax=Malassezia yamatoensis TaxID=253288 RepID=A0AAJ6CHH1_9BASI|nr:hypothetical protein MYAM1_000546 [Malassezia yamatoensis]